MRSILRFSVAGILASFAPHAGAQSPGHSHEPPSETSPRLDWNQPIWCATDKDGNPIRIQADPSPLRARRVLVAPGAFDDGTELARLSTCQRLPDSVRTEQLMEAEQVIPAIAETEPGWYRDERGRVFQISFDLMKRMVVGVAWRPTFDLTNDTNEIQQARLELGFVSSWLVPEKRSRHTLRLAEGSLAVDSLEARGQLLSYEFSHASSRPLLRFTTFFGTPRRYDSQMDVGVGVRLLGVHHRPHRMDDLVDLEIGELHAAWYPWQSADLYDYVRLRLGAAVGGLWDAALDRRQSFRVGPTTGLDFRFTLDPWGFHNISANAEAGIPWVASGQDRGSTSRRGEARAGYEVIFLAVNDQPLSLRLDGDVSYRDDLPPELPRWVVGAHAGLRFSFWAPALIREPLPSRSARRTTVRRP